MAKRQGRKSAAQTPAPRKERIYGSKKNPKGSASSEKTASKIKLSQDILKGLQKKLKEFKEKNPSKKNVTLADLKAVFRRGAGAYSKSHRPFITGGVPNSRNAWAYARVNKFLKKASGQKVKAAYVQDDDLLKREDGGEVFAKGGLIAPNGKKSNLTPEQYKLVRTPQFKEWFGDWENDPENASKVVDENGEPLVVYHGSDNVFNVFKSDKQIYFATNKEYASEISESGRVKSFFINIRNLLDATKFYIDDYSYWEYKTFLKKNGIDVRITSIDNEIVSKFWYLISNSRIWKSIKEKYDGFSMYENMFATRGKIEEEDFDDPFTKVYVCFEANQIKLADGSNKTFDGGNPDIRYAEGGQTFNDKELLAKWKRGESIGFTAVAHLKAKGLIPRADGTKRKSAKYLAEGGETFEKRFGKEVYVKLSRKDLDDFAPELLELIKTAYGNIGGHFEFNNVNDLKNTDLNYWVGIDVDDDPDADALLGGKTTNAGTKITVGGQDGSKLGKINMIRKMKELLTQKGFYAEMDYELAEKIGAKRITDLDLIKKVLSKSDINYLGDGVYERNISGKLKEKVLVGIPDKFAEGGETRIPFDYGFIGSHTFRFKYLREAEDEEVENFFDSNWQEVARWSEGKGRGTTPHAIYTNGSQYLLEREDYGFDGYNSPKYYFVSINDSFAKGGEIDPKVLRERWAKKKDALQNLANNIQRLRTNLSKDLKEGDEKERLTALVVKVMDETGERVGNDVSADNGHFGVTGLKKKHIKVNGSNLKFKYTGKSGVEHEKEINDSTLANAMREAINNSPSEYVFETSDGFRIKNDRVNRYLNRFDVSAKDLRGYSANKWIITRLKSVKDREILGDAKKRKTKFNEIVKDVAEKVGHGRATLKKHYLLPSLEREFINHGKIVDLSNIKRTYEDGGEIDLGEAKRLYSIAYGGYDGERLSQSQKRSQSMKSHYAQRKLKKLIGFDIGDLPSHTHEQKKIREQIINSGEMKKGGSINDMIALPDTYSQYERLKEILRNQGYDLTKKGMARGGDTHDEVNTGFDALANLETEPLNELADVPNDGLGIYDKGGKTQYRDGVSKLVNKESVEHLIPTFEEDDINWFKLIHSKDLINQLLENIGIPIKVKFELGEGANGTAWMTENDTVLKLTKNGAEAYSSYIIFKNQENFRSQAEIYNIFIINDYSKVDVQRIYFIEKQFLNPFQDSKASSISHIYNDIEATATATKYSNDDRLEMLENIIRDENLSEQESIYARQVFALAKDVDKEAKAYGINLGDNHSGNVGFDNDGKLLCYDCAYLGNKKLNKGGNLKNEKMENLKVGGEISQEEKKEIYAKWRKLVNMSKSELQKFYDSEEGKQAGLTPEEAKEAGIDSGRESARWIMKMKDTKVANWTPTMWMWAKKQISFISRMSGNKGKLVDENGKKTRKYLSLLIWGNDPNKKASGGDVEEPCHVCSMSDAQYQNLPALKEMSDGKRFVYRESVFAKGGDTMSHVGDRYLILECMGEGGITDTLNLKVIQSSSPALLVGSTINRPIRNIINKGREMGTTFGEAITGNYKKGGELNPDNKAVKNYFEHKSGSAGGLLVGKRHSEGGIKAINKSTGQPLEMEGGEVVITRDAVSDPEPVTYEGKQMTKREVLSEINQSGGGVAFADGGVIGEKTA